MIYQACLAYDMGSMRTIFGLFVLFLLVLLTLRKPLIGLVVFIFLQVAQIYFYNYNPYLFVEFHLPRVVGITMLLSFAILVLVTKGERYKFYAPPQGWLMLCIWLLMLVSCKLNYTAIAGNQPVSDFFKMVIVYFIVTSIISKKSDVTICIWAYIAAGLILALKAQSNYRSEGLVVPYWGVNHNGFGGSLAMLIPLIALYLVRYKNILVRLFLGGGLALTIVCLLRTGSRSSFLAFLVVSVLIFIYLLLSRGRRRYIFLIFPLAIALIVMRTPQKMWDRYETIKYYEEDKSAMGRIYAWRAGFSDRDSR